MSPAELYHHALAVLLVWLMQVVMACQLAGLQLQLWQLWLFAVHYPCQKVALMWLLIGLHSLCHICAHALPAPLPAWLLPWSSFGPWQAVLQTL